MINNLRVLAIIPARAGSKRVKNKNIRELGGKPLITWSIEAAKESKYIDHIYVSTDSEKIQEFASKNNVDSKPLRSVELASDTASSVDVVVEAINLKSGYDLIVLLQPTSPLRKANHIDEALELYCKKKANSVISVCESEAHPSWCAPIGENLSLEKLVKNVQAKRSQDLEKTYRLNGAIYIKDIESFKSDRSLLAMENSFAYIMSKSSSVDIDTEEDFRLADILISRI